jgi:hypothetical protein
MHGTWIRADVDFGIPSVNIQFGERTVVGLRTRSALGEMDPTKPTQPGEMAVLLTKLIEERRPDLKGLSVIGMEFQMAPRMWSVWIIHPSLPAIPAGETIPAQRLELCAACKAPMYVDTPFSLAVLGKNTAPNSIDQRYLQVVEVCSEECVAAAENTKVDAIQQYALMYERKVLEAFALAGLSSERLEESAPATPPSARHLCTAVSTGSGGGFPCIFGTGHEGPHMDCTGKRWTEQCPANFQTLQCTLEKGHKDSHSVKLPGSKTTFRWES